MCIMMKGKGLTHACHCSIRKNSISIQITHLGERTEESFFLLENGQCFLGEPQEVLESGVHRQKSLTAAFLISSHQRALSLAAGAQGPRIQTGIYHWW
jgi:hypothetical protein